MSRVSRWDRPPAPKDVRWFLRLVGKVLIGTGLLMFGFVAYQLWGTGIEYARAQNRAENQFEELMASASTSPAPTTTTTPTSAPPTTLPAAASAPDSVESTTSSTSSTTTSTTTIPVPTTSTIPSFAEAVAAMNITEGSAFARLEIPAIELETFVFPGVERGDLENGPGHFPNTPMPGQLGNSAMAGHRTTYGHPFLEIDQIQPGDQIIVTVPYGRFVYVMTSFEIVAPSDTQVIATTDPTVARLTLTSCHPAYSARERYILYADLDLTQSTAPGQPIFNYGRDQPAPAQSGLPGEEPPAETTTEPTSTVATTIGSTSESVASTTPSTESTSTVPATTETPDSLYSVTPGGDGLAGQGQDDGGGGNGEAFSNRWFTDREALPHVALWAAVCAVIVAAAYQLAKRFRNSWIGLAAGVAPFVVGLYFFYENVNRLLPAAL